MYAYYAADLNEDWELGRVRPARRVPHPVLIGHAASLTPY